MSFSLDNDTNLNLQFSLDPSYERKELNCTGLSLFDKDRFLYFFINTTLFKLAKYGETFILPCLI